MCLASHCNGWTRTYLLLNWLGRAKSWDLRFASNMKQMKLWSYELWSVFWAEHTMTKLLWKLCHHLQFRGGNSSHGIWLETLLSRKEIDLDSWITDWRPGLDFKTQVIVSYVLPLTASNTMFFNEFLIHSFPINMYFSSKYHSNSSLNTLSPPYWDTSKACMFLTPLGMCHNIA